jgi:hypothetical protein
MISKPSPRRATGSVRSAPVAAPQARQRKMRFTDRLAPLVKMTLRARGAPGFEPHTCMVHFFLLRVDTATQASNPSPHHSKKEEKNLLIKTFHLHFVLIRSRSLRRGLKQPLVEGSDRLAAASWGAAESGGGDPWAAPARCGAGECQLSLDPPLANGLLRRRRGLRWGQQGHRLKCRARGGGGQDCPPRPQPR